MDTFAALALATDPPTEKILDRKPTPKSAALITTNMWKMVIGQAIYQLAVTLILYFAGHHIFKYSQRALYTVVFNTFVLMHIFNQFNNRRLDNKLNVFEGLHRNWFFIGISLIMIGGQIMIVFVGGDAFQIQRLTGAQWAVSILCALPCFVWAVLLRCVPDRWAAFVFSIAGRIWFAFYRPTIKALSIVVRPICRACKAVFAPTKRFSKRSVAARFHKDSDDEEAGVKMANVNASVPQTPIKQKPVTPPPDVMVSSPPPITLTTA